MLQKHKITSQCGECHHGELQLTSFRLTDRLTNLDVSVCVFAAVDVRCDVHGRRVVSLSRVYADVRIKPSFT